MTEVQWKARIHREEGSYWAEVVDLPGCFASGDTFDELVEALREAITLSVEDDVSSAMTAEIEVAELTVSAEAPEPQAA